MLGFLPLLGALWTAPSCEGGFCMCAVREDVATELAQAHAVFTGRVVAVGDTVVGEGRFPGPYVRRVTLRVDRAWKGVESDTIVVLTGMNDGACGVRFRRGASYLVFAHAADDGSLVTGLCDRTTRLRRAARTIRELGEPARRWPG